MSPDRQRIYLSPPHMGGAELDYVREAFDTNWISPAGPQLTAFENELAAYLGIEHCAALSSGTAAIHLALIILGITKGDEVICSSFTFAGSCFPILYQGATPIFVDSEKESWNMDPDLLREAIKDRLAKTDKKPKAIIVVHLYGMPAQMDEILAIAKEFEIPVIEDAAEALGSEYKDKKVGTMGDIGVYSFNGNKIITTSGGGALVSRTKAWIDKARFLATQARDPVVHYQHSEVGFNYRLSNVSAAIGRGQLKVLEDRVDRRRHTFDSYVRHLGAWRGFSFQNERANVRSNRWLTTLRITREEGLHITPKAIMQALEARNIESRPVWKPMEIQPVFHGSPTYSNGTALGIFECGICLPSGTQISDDIVEEISEIIGDLAVT